MKPSTTAMMMFHRKNIQYSLRLARPEKVAYFRMGPRYQFILPRGVGKGALRPASLRYASFRFAPAGQVTPGPNSGLRPHHLLLPVLVSQLEDALPALGLQDDIRVPCPRRTREAQSRRLLRRADLHRRAATLGDQPQQHRLDPRVTRPRHHRDARPYPSLRVDDLESAPAQHRRRARLRERRTDLPRQRHAQEREVDHRER